MSTAAYTRRQFVIYRELVERGVRKDPDTVLTEFLAANPEVDLDETLTFAEWIAAAAPDGATEGAPVTA